MQRSQPQKITGISIQTFLRNRKAHFTCAWGILYPLPIPPPFIAHFADVSRKCRRKDSTNDICTLHVVHLSHIEPLRTSESEGTASIMKYLFSACAFPWVMARQSINFVFAGSESSICSLCFSRWLVEQGRRRWMFHALQLTSLRLMHIWYADMQPTLAMTLDGQREAIRSPEQQLSTDSPYKLFAVEIDSTSIK